ncbi:hypothetical protein PIB30_034556 [Stylosanthes scabra]|uniref:Uncharacterized protein n=1 Tax=Stylosanthes scabra TaxID=79078 RepID=A0ABU6TCJ9_9FABA|nr:hypothetical protein [Stylosanthes scabra]
MAGTQRGKTAPLLLGLPLSKKNSTPSICHYTHSRVSSIHRQQGFGGIAAALKNAFTQDVPDQEEAGQEDEAEQAHSLLDPHEDRQHHQVQCEAQALAPHKARVLRILGSEHHVCELRQHFNTQILICFVASG